MREQTRVLPAPESCPICSSANVVFCSNKVLYGKELGDWPYIYFCKDCRASVGCHKKTKVPLGRMANAKTKRLRVEAHANFDKLWLKGFKSRTLAYKWLSIQLGIPIEECHISWLTDDQLIETAKIAEKYLVENLNALIRRKEKKSAKAIDRAKRELEAVKRKQASGQPRFPGRPKRH